MIRALVSVHFIHRPPRNATLYHADTYNWPGVPRRGDIIALAGSSIGLEVAQITWEEGYVHLWVNVVDDSVTVRETLVGQGLYSESKQHALDIAPHAFQHWKDDLRPSD